MIDITLFSCKYFLIKWHPVFFVFDYIVTKYLIYISVGYLKILIYK